MFNKDGRAARRGGGGWSPEDRLPPAVEVGARRTAIRLELVAQGRDLVLLITGGDAHVGAAAVAAPGSGGAVHEAVLPPHKEGPLARECAALLADAAGCTVCAVAGIHQDAITKDEIAAIVANVREAAAALAATLRGDR
jgi:hypothetical protein